MASLELKVKENIEGPFYVDENCIACGLCVKEAPIFFAMNKTMLNAYVYKAPIISKINEWEKFVSVEELCPVGSIGHESFS